MKRTNYIQAVLIALFAFIAALLNQAEAANKQPVAQQTVSLVFVGDVVLDGKAGQAIEQGRDPFTPFADVFKAADIRVANLECVIATTGEQSDKMFTFRAHPRTLDVLKKHFDVLALANNHSGDFGRVAFAEMLDLLDRQSMLYVGGGRNLREAHKPVILERKGLRIALLSYNEFMPRSFEADYNAPGIAWSEDEQVRLDIKAARKVHRADLVIPIMHWGWENEPLANARQRQLARLMIDAGANAVIGGHPHVTQDIENYKGVPIVYSVGNFVMQDIDNPNQAIGWVLQLQLDRFGVKSFQTRVAQLNDDGLPHPLPAQMSPCWTRGNKQVGSCEAGR
jgi:poly-gamma-glutamate synthesis protein (capsule biosynthesis protein)